MSDDIDGAGLRCPTCGADYPATARFCTNDGTPLAAAQSDDPLIGTRLDGRYLVLRKIGAGGMGTVYEGVQLSIDRPVAIKVIRHSGRINQRQRQRFWMEARAVSRLEHPNVVRVYDFGTGADDSPFLVMELLRGHSIGDLATRDGLPLPSRAALTLITSAARGLAAAHRQGLVHRDIKPSNLWIQEEGETEGTRVKVLDFGLVTGGALEDRVTGSGEAVGTPAYMSPEQIEGRLDVTAAADVYALGALLFELVVGELPYKGESAIDLMSEHLLTPVPDPKTSVTGMTIPSDIRAIWARALSKEAAERYADANAMLKDLEQAVGTGVTHTAMASDPMLPLKMREFASRATEDHPTPIERRRRPTGRGPAATSRIRERKRVTSLSVRLADAPGQEPIDLEERLDLTSDQLEAWATLIEEAGGSPEIVPGYGVQAVFGLPNAGEDDTRRALECGLTMAGEAGGLAPELRARIGIHTSSMLATLDPDDPSGFRVVGDPFEAPERAAAQGAPGGGMPILTGPAYRTLHRTLAEPLPEVGKLDGDGIFVVEPGEDALRTHRISVDLGDKSKTIGRSREIDRVGRQVIDAITNRESQVVLVTGEPGVGKTRLMLEVARKTRLWRPDV